MKITLLIIAIISCQSIFGQDINKSISYISPKRDTLMLPNNAIGNIIHKLWKSKPLINEPVIILTDELTISKMRKEALLVEPRKDLIKVNPSNIQPLEYYEALFDTRTSHPIK